MGEDASRVRARHAPANSAPLNNIALAIVFHHGFRYLPEANLHFMMTATTRSRPSCRPAEPPRPSNPAAARPGAPRPPIATILPRITAPRCSPTPPANSGRPSPALVPSADVTA